ncbi:midasin-like [Centruroides sculpturatus]|uniref:midasin-like n=1 Tax=Centruroides sculpturatus TaxID=218467 RepID=UPI000C6CB1F3|nr:midasin-like [Centruroides sculpturatus]
MEDLEDKEDLAILIDSYLKGLTLSTETVNNIVKFYIQIRKDAECKYSDGTGHHPHYSLRTLCRALDYAGRNPCYCVPRSLFEGFCLSFLTQLDRSSHPLVIKQIKQHILKKNQQSILHQPIKQPGEKFICFEGYWIQRGENNPVTPSNYILTPSVKQNLKDLARIVSAGKHPVLLQGETSVGKTSLIQWLASVSGNKCVRINNHEHSDLQEYVGNYTSDDDGKLFFKEGILVEAMKFGYWIILDELNLAPTEVLEALNRILSRAFRNRFIELHFDEIPPEELQTILEKRCALPPTYSKKLVNVMQELQIRRCQSGIFAGKQGYITLRDLFRWGERYRLSTQTEKFYDWNEHLILSRAFRNRFIELHFDEIPPEELQTILEKRCALPPTYSKKLVNVMQELQIRRCQSGIFAGKQGYITLRDLFRWGERYRLSTQTEKFYDWNEHLANEGYMLLAGRVRKQEEADVIQEVIEKCMHCKIKPKLLFTNGNGIDNEISKVLFDLKSDTLPEEFSHIVWTSNMKRLAILVSQAMKFGEPVLLVGETGKDTYLNMSDSQKLFEWVDGPLTLSMKTGNIFLADEISLADDSVLERLNSVLEPECTLLLAEKGNSENNLQEIIVTAKDGFQFLATMNPGGDFGKKELSPALRNRFTEIWCPSTTEKEDIINIIKHNIKHPIITNERKDSFGKIMMEFLEWFRNNDFGYRYSLSIRDILSWVNFINYSTSKNSNIAEIHLSHAYIHGACLVILDSLGSGMTSDSNSHQIKCAYDISVKFLEKQMKKFLNETEFLSFDLKKSAEVTLDQEWFGIEPFYIPMGLKTDCSLEKKYILSSESTKLNAIRLLRAMYLPKPILLEGIPGVGKTSLVCALAKASGHQLIRINLSEQTDISDLFGSDLPVEGKCGIFAWRDGPLLQALKSGSWILLDELNLASQSVLEGLNACLDHRGEVYIPELGRSFKVQQGRSWIFGCQNPYKQGGARKGLPRSFLNRFTQIVEEIQIQKLWGEKGPSWEFNLRDILRWCEVLLFNQDKNDINPGEYVDLIYGDRMRTLSDKKKVLELYEKIFGKLVISQPLQLRVTDKIIQVGYSFLPRLGHFPSSNPLFPLHNQLKPLQSLMKCIEMKWLAILVGSSSVGKTSIVNLLATLTGQSLFIFTVNSEMDTTDLLGGFEQRDLTRHLDKISKDLEKICKNILWSTLSSENYSKNEIKYLFESWNAYHHLCFKLPPSRTNEEIKVFQNKIDALWKIINCLNKLLIPNIISPTIYEV